MYDAVADLLVTVESVELERRARDTPEFERVTTVVSLSGDGETGRGEDVTYEAEHHDDLLDADPDFDLAGEYTFAEFSARLDDADFWPTGLPERRDFVDYRRWAFEAAALDLGLRQAGETLADRLDRAFDPVRFVVSSRVPEGDTGRIETLLDRYPAAELKLDVSDEWTDDTFDYLESTGAVRVLDLKGQYEGTEVDTVPDAALYERVFETFPDAVVEDPGLTDETRPVVDRYADQISWDAIIHGLDDVRSLPFEPDWLNIKPSRFGTLESLLETVAWALDNDVALYGGGQFELDVGRGQLHEVASLFYADGPNDVAPRAYNDAELPENPPESPIQAPEDHDGFGF
ncbi:enolase-like domain-containing protein [Halobacterium litoreum]|uniref:L-alanine-DL-glutamate epimerase n=1 Tax=Halobacterium litoreum TaxID=2039234 RepID=A0ABD5NDK8_9EURY|nr:hypothetical protein [Halobacterium litoreum]UHH13889.1 hypothetical protein LT972_02560 [Halobacterium litoreum]